jgi:hypothetical protein
LLSYALLLQVYGDDNVVALLQQLKPSVIIPFMNAEMQVLAVRNLCFVGIVQRLCSIMPQHINAFTVTINDIEASLHCFSLGGSDMPTGWTQASGPLSLLIRQKGSLSEFERKLQDAGLSDVRVQPVAPPPTPMTVEV